MSEPDRPPRYNTAPLPPYSYVPGHSPHPVSDPRGHMHGRTHAPVPALDPTNWQASDAYRYAVDLFNGGFYWEAHEAWEALWHAAGRRGPVAAWLKALIKLAAAAVKLREGNAAGVQRHARRALQLFAEVRRHIAPPATAYAGVELSQAEALAHSLESAASADLHADPHRRLTASIVLR
jgi:hypothetical protein